MAWKTESIGHYYTRAALSALDLGEDIVDDLSEHATNRTQYHTPVSDARSRTQDRASRTLKTSIVKSKTKVIHGIVVGGVESFDPVAPHREYGTGLFGRKGRKYTIKPVTARALRFYFQHSTRIANSTGARIKPRRQFKYVFAKKVEHPGSKGAHMFLKGIMDTQTAAPRIIERRMRIWEREMNRVLPATSVTNLHNTVSRLVRRRRRG